MVLTPQLLQAIKLLQMPNPELTQFIENELASNPLLERAEEREAPSLGADATRPASPKRQPSPATGPRKRWRRSRRPRRQSRHGGRQRLRRRPRRAAVALGAGRGLERAGVDRGRRRPRRGRSPGSRSLCRRVRIASRSSRAAGGDPARRPGRADDRRRADRRARRGRIFRRLDSAKSPSGSAPMSNASSACSSRMQTLEPTGVFARSLAECLALQLKERDRFDPAMQALIENLPALAKRDFAAAAPRLRRRRRRPADMIAEISRLDPKPGRAFGDPPSAPAIPDVHVTAAPDFGWRVELNTRRCRACSSTRSMRPRSGAAPSATRTANTSPPSCRRRTG